VYLLSTRGVNQQLYKNFLVRNNIYSETISIASDFFGEDTELQTQKKPAKTFISQFIDLETITGETQSFNPSQIITQSLISKSLTPELLQTIAETYIDELFPYIKGETDTLDLQNPLQIILAQEAEEPTLVDDIKSTFDEYVNKIPICTPLTQDSCISQDEAAEIEDYNIEDYVGTQISKVKNQNLFTDNESESSTKAQPLIEAIRIAYTKASSVYYIGGGISLFLILLLFLFTPKQGKNLLTLLANLFIAISVGFSFIAGLVLFGVWSAGQSLLIGGAFVPASLIELVKSLVLGLTFEIQSPLYIASLILLTVGIVIKIIAGTMDEKEDVFVPHIDDEEEDDSEDKTEDTDKPQQTKTEEADKPKDVKVETP